MKIYSMLIACCIFKATKTHSEQVYVILTAFPRHIDRVNASQYYVSSQNSCLAKKN
jgi:hypothetical protein